MHGPGPISGASVSPAASYALHRQRVLASAFPIAAVVIVALTITYAAIDMMWRPNTAQLATYALEIAVPLVALALARGPLARHAEAMAFAADLAFTAVLAGRLMIPSTTESGTALFLSIKMLATAALFPWNPRLQYLASASTLLLYYAAIAFTGRSLPATHQVTGPIIAAVLSCLGAALADRTRRALWQQSVDLTAAEQRARALLEAERLVTAVARASPPPLTRRMTTRTASVVAVKSKANGIATASATLIDAPAAIVTGTDTPANVSAAAVSPYQDFSRP